MNGFEILPSAGGGSDPLKLDLAGGTMTGQLVLQLASATGALNVSPVWNNGATTFVGIYGRVTNTASGASSKLIDLGTVAGGSLFSVDAATGKVSSGPGTNNGGYYLNSTAYGMDNSSGYGPTLVSNGSSLAAAVQYGEIDHIVTPPGGGFGFSGSTTWLPDTMLFRSGAGRIAQKNSVGYVATNIYPTVVAQAFEVYNIYTSSTNYERFVIDWQDSPNVVKIATQVGGTGGTARDIEIATDNVTRITVKASGAILFSGLPGTDPGVSGQLWNDSGTLKISP